MWRVEGVLYNKEESCWFRFRLMGIFWKTKKRPDPEDQDAGHAVPPDIRLWRIHDRRTHCRRCPYHKTERTVGGKIGALDNGSIRLFLRINVFAALRGGYTRAASPAYVGENVISEKRLRDHFHEHCESLTPTGFSLRAMASCTPSHQRDMDIGIDDTDSIAHAAVVCQEENGKIRGSSHGV